MDSETCCLYKIKNREGITHTMTEKNTPEELEITEEKATQNDTENPTSETAPTSETKESLEDVVIIAEDANSADTVEATDTDLDLDEELTDEELAILDDGDFEPEDFEDEEPKGKIAKHMGKILYSLLGIMIVAVLIFGYCVFPFYSKIGGTWNGTNTAGTFQIVNKGSESKFSFVDMNGIKGMDLVFTSTLNRKGINQYDVKDTTVSIVLDKTIIKDEQIKEFKSLTDQVKVKSETKKELVLTYTKEAYKAAFAEIDVDSYFNYRLTNFNFTLQGKDLMLKNKDFASPEITFTHK